MFVFYSHLSINDCLMTNEVVYVGQPNRSSSICNRNIPNHLIDMTEDEGLGYGLHYHHHQSINQTFIMRLLLSKIRT